MTSYPLYLNGQYVPGEKPIEVRNPATGNVFATVGTVSRERVREAIADAHCAFEPWRSLTASQRSKFLETIAANLQREAEALAKMITAENGKPLAQSKAEVALSIDHLHWFAGEARRAYGRTIPNAAAGKRHLVIKTPIGVVAAISPWNFPLLLAVRKVAPALAAGCPVILKPARQTPLSVALLANAINEAKLPPGVFQWALGDSRQIGNEFLTNPLCRKISFTGSTEVGKELIRGAAEQVKPLSLELGGQAPCLVFDDADLIKAVEGVLLAKFRNTGQSCIAANRIYVQSGIYNQFLDQFVARIGNMKTGNGEKPEVEIGPMIDKDSLEKAERHIQNAVELGARLLYGGKRKEGYPGGYFLEPTVLADVPEGCLCACEETFGPVAPVLKFTTEEEAIQSANNSRFGLSAYVFTTNLDRAFRCMERLEAGIIGLNDGVPTATQAPFGGVKESGWGRELGSEGIDAFLETKHVSIQL
ncbi:MAG: NAD-dependent succinate-semialdehyde dehydrogenase [Verrucomicrobiales bacterium]